MSVRSPESRQIASLLVERKVSGGLMVAVLSGAFVFGLIGFVLHTFWVVAIVLLAIGLGYVVANARKDHSEVV